MQNNDEPTYEISTTTWKIKPEREVINIESVPEYYDWKNVYVVDGHLIPESLLSLLYTKVE